MFLSLRNIARIRPFLSFNDAKKLFMYLSVYTVYTGLPKGSLVKLQLIQNAAARVLMKLKKREHTTPVLMNCIGYLCIKGLTIRFLH